MGNMTLLGAGGPSAPVGSLLAWDPAATSSDVTLSNGNLTATRNAGTGGRNMRANTPLPASGKVFWAYVFNAVAADGGVFIGANLSTYTLTADLGTTTGSVGFRGQGVAYYGGSSQGAVEFGVSMSNAETLMAADMTAGLLWYYNPAYLQWASYVAGPTVEDPVTGVGGWPFATGPTGTKYPAASLNAGSDSVTLRTSGFSNMTQVTALLAGGYTVLG